jgi:hypothetical protein
MYTPPDEQAVEELIAELQLWRAGLRPHAAEQLGARIDAARPGAERLGLAGFLASLARPHEAPDISHAFLDLDAEEPQRRASYERWREAAERALPSLWSWISAVRSRGDWATWWCRDLEPAPPADTVAQMRVAAPPLAPIGPLAARWAEEAGVKDGAAEHQWRWLALGRGLCAPMPDLADLLRALVRRLREYGLLSPGHRVQVIRRPNRPSMVMPVRAPGESVLFLPTATSPLSIQYTLHELVHLAEHALRPPAAPLIERWRFDIVRSEGLALLFERLCQDPRWLEGLGFLAGDARRLARFFREEEAFTRGIIAADVALDERVGAARSLEEALGAAAGIARRLEIEWSPAIMLFRLPGVMSWRAYVAAWPWRDAALASLERRFGPAWPEAPAAWATLRAALASVGSASGMLSALEAAA